MPQGRGSAACRPSCLCLLGRGATASRPFAKRPADAMSSHPYLLSVQNSASPSLVGRVVPNPPLSRSTSATHLTNGRLRTAVPPSQQSAPTLSVPLVSPHTPYSILYTLAAPPHKLSATRTRRNIPLMPRALPVGAVHRAIPGTQAAESGRVLLHLTWLVIKMCALGTGLIRRRRPKKLTKPRPHAHLSDRGSTNTFQRPPPRGSSPGSH
jgi:hypothetical protein